MCAISSISWGQLSFDDLLFIHNKKNNNIPIDYILNRKFSFVSSSNNSNGTNIKYAIGYDKLSSSPKATEWLDIFYVSDIIYRIKYQFPQKSKYNEIKNKLTSKGFKFLRSANFTDLLALIYTNGKLEIELSISSLNNGENIYLIDIYTIVK